MNNKLKTVLASIAAVVTMGLGVGSQIPAAHALTGTPEPTSWGKANLISYADSDFESGVGNWGPVSNSTMSQDTTAAVHGKDSLRVAASAAGTAVVKMGTATLTPQVSFTGGKTYRVSGWFKSAQTGRTITFAEGFYDSTGTWIGWTSGTATTLNKPGAWQYVSQLITAPSNATNAISSPRITETGMNAGEALNVDMVMTEPYRAATLIGAKDPSTDASAFATADSTIGPLQADKMFYSTSLPSSYSASNCAALPVNVTCVQAYKTQTTNVASYVASIPAGRNTVLVYHQEPEGDYTSGSVFVTEDEGQANLVHNSVTASNRANVFFADDAGGYNYGNTRLAADCSYIVPSSYIDIYLMDHYETPDNNGNLTLDPDNKWAHWLSCVTPMNKPIGIAEYGLDGTDPANPNNLSAATTLSADQAYLKSEPANLPVVMWQYWWYNNDGHYQFTPTGSPNGATVTSTWQAGETENGGGAH